MKPKTSRRYKWTEDKSDNKHKILDYKRYQSHRGKQQLVIQFDISDDASLSTQFIPLRQPMTT